MQLLNIRNIHIASDQLLSNGELIVFIHGVGADRTAWKYQLPFFHSKGYSVAALDMRGSGDSDARDDHGNLLPISLHEFALDVDAVIGELGYKKAHWVGNSMGGVIILEALSQHLLSVDKIALCNTFAFHPDKDQILPRAEAALKIKSLPDFAKERIPLVLRTDIDAATLGEAIYAMARKDPEAYRASWQATWSPDYRAMLSGIDHPTLIVSGSLDNITPTKLSDELAAHIPGARHVHISGAGHISNMDKPEEFNSALVDFLKE
ncbi:MAG: alpha/beta fold hydrolase [Bacteroidota bacterium]|nr:alpha/beta fold hydrolase [Bacteroidota bacterium]MDP4228898.1 alpha/beta fold hydrolase [Bacteroidota bacterium]MDP4237358.1 alpha/beta fold hydrolase [Bacteroidota bacterium]